ncbi:CBS domain-containing protein [Portibacter marinus]|uniref:CBS domain-containing protein n=1 Tax=Portibacter marinus TaxID=2898660 RepID=UPI001F448BA9|nr:CBS domain-containing protein [Portibacter marinus]
MNLLAPVHSIMTKELTTISPEDTIKKVEDLFRTHKIHHLPVEKDGKFIGMVSKSDYLHFKRGFNEIDIENKWDLFRLKSHTVDEIMTRKIARLAPEDKINVAIEIFKENLFHAIPIVDGERLVGIVTTLDIIKHLSEDKEIYKSYTS